MIRIRTRYKTRPGSNVGKYVAQGAGLQATSICDQALGNEANHSRAAYTLATRLVAAGVLRSVDVLDIRLVESPDALHCVWEVGGTDHADTSSTFRCPECGAISHHPKDVAEGYCGRCHKWTREDKQP